MDWQNLINIGLSAILTAVGWWCRAIWDSMNRLKDDIRKIEVDLPTNYVRKVDIDDRLNKIENVLERIFDKLDKKVDK